MNLEAFFQPYIYGYGAFLELELDKDAICLWVVTFSVEYSFV